VLGPSTTTPGSSVPGGFNVHLYFLDGTQLRAVTRSLPNGDPQSVLDELAKGVTDTDPTGITTAIPKDTKIVSTSMDGDTLVVTLSNEIFSVTGAEQKNAFAQVVYTATDLDIRSVRFRVADASGGNQQDVPTPTDVGSKDGPVTRSDFVSLQPR
jgi:spore germination protein GerM